MDRVPSTTGQAPAPSGTGQAPAPSGPAGSAPNPRLASRRLRIKLLRLRVAGFAVAVFIVAWVAIFTQLASGNDPALGGGGAEQATQTGAVISSSSGLTGTSAPTTAPANAQAVAPTPLTTSQS